MLVFFAMFGSTFLLTQYLQFVLGYTPFETGIRLPAVARRDDDRRAARARGSSHRIGTKLVVGAGLLLVSPACARLVGAARRDSRVLARRRLAA